MLSSLSTADLHRELQRRQGMVNDMRRRRDELARELDVLDSELSQFGPAGGRGRKALGAGKRRGPGRPPGSGAGKRRGGRRRGGRGVNAKSLVESLREVLAGRTLSIREMTEQVQKGGYKSSSSNFRTIVNQALIAHPEAFKKVARGQYTAK